MIFQVDRRGAGGARALSRLFRARVGAPSAVKRREVESEREARAWLPPPAQVLLTFSNGKSVRVFQKKKPPPERVLTLRFSSGREVRAACFRASARDAQRTRAGVARRASRVAR